MSSEEFFSFSDSDDAPDMRLSMSPQIKSASPAQDAKSPSLYMDALTRSSLSEFVDADDEFVGLSPLSQIGSPVARYDIDSLSEDIPDMILTPDVITPKKRLPVYNGVPQNPEYIVKSFQKRGAVDLLYKVVNRIGGCDTPYGNFTLNDIHKYITKTTNENVYDVLHNDCGMFWNMISGTSAMKVAKKIYSRSKFPKIILELIRSSLIDLAEIYHINVDRYNGDTDIFDVARAMDLKTLIKSIESFCEIMPTYRLRNRWFSLTDIDRIGIEKGWSNDIKTIFKKMKKLENKELGMITGYKNADRGSLQDWMRKKMPCLEKTLPLSVIESIIELDNQI